MNLYNVVSHGGGVLTVDVLMDYGQDYKIMLSSDRHFDSTHSNGKLEIQQLNKLTEFDALIDIGDLFDAMQGRQDRRRSLGDLKDEHKQENYFDSLVDSAHRRYKLYADKIIGLGHGNHETAIVRHYGTDLTARLAAALNPDIARLGYSGYIILRCRYGSNKRRKTKVAKTFIIRYHHGSGGGAVVTKGRIKANRRAVVYSNADIVWSGHTHQADLMQVAKERVKINGKIQRWLQWHLVTPGYKQHGQWETEKEFLPEPVGCAWLSFRWCDRMDWGISLDVK